jgi:hypothetical protein
VLIKEMSVVFFWVLPPCIYLVFQMQHIADTEGKYCLWHLDADGRPVLLCRVIYKVKDVKEKRSSSDKNLRSPKTD